MRRLAKHHAIPRQQLLRHRMAPLRRRAFPSQTPQHSTPTVPAPSAESSVATGTLPAGSPSVPASAHCSSKAARSKPAAPPSHRSSTIPSTPNSKAPPASPPDTLHPRHHADPERTKPRAPFRYSTIADSLLTVAVAETTLPASSFETRSIVCGGAIGHRADSFSAR